MTAINLHIGPHAAFYIGTQGASAVLTKMNCIRENGTRLVDDTPDEYVAATDKHEQIDNRSITLTATFTTDNDIIYKISNKIELEGTVDDDPNPNNQYVIFVADSRASSYVITNCSIAAAQNINYQKDKATAVTIVFKTQHRNPATVSSRFTRGSISKCATALGSRSPL